MTATVPAPMPDLAEAVSVLRDFAYQVMRAARPGYYLVDGVKLSAKGVMDKARRLQAGRVRWQCTGTRGMA